MKTPRKLKVWRKKFKDMDYDFDELKYHGFQFRLNGSCHGAWINRKERVVIKQPYVCRYSSIPVTAPPTIMIFKDSDKPIMIQVLCQTPSNYKEAGILVRKVEKRNRHDETDIHTGNVGLYRNKPVLFDW